MAQNRSDGHLRNRLLAAIPQRAFSTLQSSLRTTTLVQGAVVQEVGEPIKHIYFPQDGMISLVVITQPGSGIEAATIGYEGAVGLHGGLGKRRAFTRAIIQVPGTFSQISAEEFARA